MIPVESSTGRVTVGRHPARLDEVPQAFIDGRPDAAERRELWEEWLDATSILMNHVSVGFAWLSGSFFGPKQGPDDIDSVYWVDESEIARASTDAVAAQVVDLFSAKGAVRKELELRVDTFILAWVCNPMPYPGSPEHVAYYQTRGYWDDLWLRERSGPKGATPTRLDALPRRGYLEVRLDGLDERSSSPS